MADIVQGMLRDAATVFRTGSQELLEDVERRDDQVDYLEREIKLYLTRLARQTMTEDLSHREIALLGFIGNLENIGDIIDKNLMELARKKLYQGRRFSEAGEAELLEFHAAVSKNLERAIVAFATGDRSAGPGGAGAARDRSASGSGSCASRTSTGCAPGWPSRSRPPRSTSTSSPTSSASTPTSRRSSIRSSSSEGGRPVDKPRSRHP